MNAKDAMRQRHRKRLIEVSP